MISLDRAQKQAMGRGEKPSTRIHQCNSLRYTDTTCIQGKTGMLYHSESKGATMNASKGATNETPTSGCARPIDKRSLVRGGGGE